MSGSKLSKNLNAGDDQPLALTVHGVPVPGQAMAQSQRTGRGRWTMLVLLLACAAPVVASYVTYYFIRPEARRVFGELVDPQRPLPALAATALDGQPTPLNSLKGQWLLVSVADVMRSVPSIYICSGSCERVWAKRKTGWIGSG